MKFVVFIIATGLVIGGVFFLFRERKQGAEVAVRPWDEPRIIEGWPDGVPESGALKEKPQDVKPKLDIAGWDEYKNESMGISFKYPAKTEESALNLEPRLMEENKVGPWFFMQDVLWLATVHLVEEIRNDAEGFFVISIFKKEGKFEDAVQKVREFEVSGKKFLSERAVKSGDLEGIRIAAANTEETSYAIAYILRGAENPDKIFILDIAIDRITEPEETEEQFTRRLRREQEHFDAVASTFRVL